MLTNYEMVKEFHKAFGHLIADSPAFPEANLRVLRKDLIDEVSSDLTLTQQEKFQSFAEGIEFEGDVDGYQRKLEIIKENY